MKTTEQLIKEAAGRLKNKLVDLNLTTLGGEFILNYTDMILEELKKELATIAGKSADEAGKQIKSIPLSVMDIALFESLKINQHFGRRLNYPELKKFRSVSNWLKYLKKTNSFSEEAFRVFREEIKLLYELSQSKDTNEN